MLTIYLVLITMYPRNIVLRKVNLKYSLYVYHQVYTNDKGLVSFVFMKSYDGLYALYEL